MVIMQDMAVRGAPAIAISAALGLAVELVNHGGGSQFSSAKEAQEAIDASLDYLVTRCDSLRALIIHFYSVATWLCTGSKYTFHST